MTLAGKVHVEFSNRRRMPLRNQAGGTRAMKVPGAGI